MEPLDFFSVGEFSFIRPDYERYPCLALAMRRASSRGRGDHLQYRQRGAVAAFSCRADRIYGYCQSQRIRHELGSSAAGSLADLIALDGWARAVPSN